MGIFKNFNFLCTENAFSAIEKITYALLVHERKRKFKKIVSKIFFNSLIGKNFDKAFEVL